MACRLAYREIRENTTYRLVHNPQICLALRIVYDKSIGTGVSHENSANAYIGEPAVHGLKTTSGVLQSISSPSQTMLFHC